MEFNLIKIKDMEVITVESEAYHGIMQKLDKIHSSLLLRASENVRVDEYGREKLLNSREVCNLLNISLTTLYRMKKKHSIAFSVIEGEGRDRLRFRLSEVERILHETLRDSDR
jgi:excisionase family DNA binding protein